jgi:hypothetical protein
VVAKVQLKEGQPRVISGKCFVTRDVGTWASESCSCSRYPHHPPDASRQLTGYPCLTLQNIDTDQIIPAEYLTLVPSKVRPIACISSSSFCCGCC